MSNISLTCITLIGIDSCYRISIHEWFGAVEKCKSSEKKEMDSTFKE